MDRLYTAPNSSRNVRWYYFKSAFLHINKGSRKQRRQMEEKQKAKRGKKRETVGKRKPQKTGEKNKQMVLFIMG